MHIPHCWKSHVTAQSCVLFQKLEFTKGGDSVPTTPTTGLPMVKIEEELDRLIVLEKKDNETVFDWIESNVDEPTTKRSKFIRALMTCVCNSAFIGNLKFVTLKIHNMTSQFPISGVSNGIFHFFPNCEHSVSKQRRS